MSTPCTCKASYGFTLIEILVALAISGIILTGTLYVFDTSNKSYIVQEDVARMQQNVRVAKFYIEKDLRMAGYGNPVDAVVFENNLSDTGILSGTDRITITYMDDDSGSFKTIRYFVDNKNCLKWEEDGTAYKLAENIEDIQVALCGDYNNDDTVDITDTGDWYNVANLDINGEMLSTDKAKIRYGRVTIVGRTAREHNGIASKRPTVEDHAGATQPDFYSRRVLSFTVKIRNLGL